MKYFELDKQEKDIEKALETGKLKRAKGWPKNKKIYQDYARAALVKTKNINIRLSEQDLLRLKAKAITEGLPYQTYLTSLIHKNLKA